jgi:hypothetical protein
MNDSLLRFDEISRRQFAARIAKTFLGVSLLPVGGAAAAMANAPWLSPKAKARRVIYLFMEGGMSHIDTFDPKPGNKEAQGPVGAISTNVDGVRLTEYLPRLAKKMDRIAVIRSMSHTQGNHEPGQYNVRTGFEHQAGVIHPSVGAWVSKLMARQNPNLPQYVRMGDLARHPGSGFFEVRHAPLPVAKPEDGLSNSRPAEGVSEERFAKRLRLAERLDAEFRRRYDHKDVRAYSDFYSDAVRMMASEDLDAFDLRKEAKATREAYGEKDSFGQGVLLARRLVERGVQFAEVDLGGWDTHTDNHKGVSVRAEILDRVLSTLLDDLQTRGMMDDTLVVVATEFGRSPEIDQYLGRNHHPTAFTCLLAGGGIRGGQVVGKTSEDGGKVIEGKVSVLDFHATIAHQLGLDTKQYFAPSAGGQKFSIIGKDTGAKGAPIGAVI